MGIADIPDSYDAVAVWFDAYDRCHLLPDPHCEAVERATRSLMLGRIPRALAPVGDGLVRAMYDGRFRTAVHAPNPHPSLAAGLHIALKGRAVLLRCFGRPRRIPLFANGIPTRSYPDGYRVEELGAESVGTEAPDPAL